MLRQPCCVYIHSCEQVAKYLSNVIWRFIIAVPFVMRLAAGAQMMVSFLLCTGVP